MQIAELERLEEFRSDLLKIHIQLRDIAKLLNQDIEKTCSTIINIRTSLLEIINAGRK